MPGRPPWSCPLTRDGSKFILITNTWKRESNFPDNKGIRPLSVDAGMTNAGPDNRVGTNKKACLRAVKGQSGCLEMHGRAIVRICWLNSMVFDHLLIMMTPSEKKSMSPQCKCFDGFNCLDPLESRFALQNRPKKATKQTAQNVAWKGSSKFKCSLRVKRIWGVNGFFWNTVKPFTCLIPNSSS